MAAPGWRSLDQRVVAGLHRRDPAVVLPSPGGRIRCPLVGHDHWLSWKDGDLRKGTEAHGEPSLRLRVSPTYILDDPLENFIAGRELVMEALSGAWGKAETARLGHENSEDAVSWNVFRSLQEAGQLKLAVQVLAGVEIDREPELILWGRRVHRSHTAPAPEIERALDELEPAFTQQTEPDIVLRVPDWGWIFIEAKFSSPTSTYTGRSHKLEAWIERYAADFPGIFNRAALAGAKPKAFPEQLLRNVAVAHAVRAAGERAVVVALVREDYASAVQDWATPYLTPAGPIAAGSGTWEQLYAALPRDDGLAVLRGYLEDKSAELRRAFKLGSRSDIDARTRMT